VELNKIYNENCLDTMSRMNDSFVDLTLTSPPYDNLRDYKGYDFPFENIAKELYRITKEGGVLVWIVGDATINGSETGNSFRQALYFMECGFLLHDTMMYEKTGTPFPSKTRYNQIFEYMFVLSKGTPKTFNPIMKKNITAGAVRHSRKFRNKDGEMLPSFNGKPVNEYGIENNIWKMKNGMNKSTKDIVAFEHPAIMPEQLVAKHIISWSNKDELVYDCFMGSGTTAKIAHLQNRNWIGSEISQQYIRVANKRLKPYLNQTKLF
jgi:DNA modification methylase